jgi:hypothetical protein
MFYLDWLRVKKLVCRDCARRFGTQDASFNRDLSGRAFDPNSYRCPRCGGSNTTPELGIVWAGEAKRPPEKAG